jgi:S1-C subfamily serine protease
VRSLSGAGIANPETSRYQAPSLGRISVSALGRTSGYGGQDEYENFIQTDASINAGNSGGALINMHGELIGINSAIISRTGGSVGIGFAIPSEMVVSVMDRLLEYGTVPRGLLGVYMDSVTPAFAADYGLAVTAGALVLDVIPESAAAAAGLRINDVITGIDGETIANSNELRNLVAMKLPGEPIEVSLVRDGRARTLEAVLKAKDSAANELPLRLESNARPSVFNGIDLMAESDNAEGLRIVDIDASALPIVRERLRRGDLIKAVNQRQVDSVEDAIRLSENFRNIVVEIERFDRTSEERQNFLLRLR